VTDWNPPHEPSLRLLIRTASPTVVGTGVASGTKSRPVLEAREVTMTQQVRLGARRRPPVATEGVMRTSTSDPGLPDDPLERTYTSSIVDEDPAPARARATASRAGLRIAASGPVALHGCVLTPERALDDAYVVLGPGQEIGAVQAQRPEGVRVHETGGVILPGLIDLHGHPEFNIFAAWEPDQLFANRYQWRRSAIYKQVVRDPWNRLKAAGLDLVATRYAEIRALVGGTTAIQGATPQYPTEEALVRNVDKRIFGAHRARSLIDLPTSLSPDLEKILDRIAAGEVTAFYVHLAEGRDGDPRSTEEFAQLVRLGALTPATILIHGTALTRAQLGVVKDAGAKLVWSPQSNLRLYGQTTHIKDAWDLGLPIGLGADWLPSGSPSLLAELKVVRRELARQGVTTTDRALVRMVTSGAAQIAGLGDHLGMLAPGRPADLLVLERRREDPWTNVVDADPSWIELVTIDGDLAYGREDWMRNLADAQGAARAEPVLAWGKPMLLDTSYAVAPHAPPPRLAELRAALIAAYPQVGPIFA
jgi:5-methylthioadenosine/S-adenosylhomocysteine deaminase